MSSPASMAELPSRREFLRRIGSGLVVWVVLRGTARAQVNEAAHPARFIPRETDDFNAFLSIGRDGRVTCFTGKIEMGQGPVTSLPQMLAEELDVSVDSVDMVMGDTELCPFDAGDLGIHDDPGVRQGLARGRGGGKGRPARARVRGAKGARVPAHGARRRGQRRAGLLRGPSPTASSTGGRPIERRLAVKPGLKSPGEFRVIGKPLLRRDSRDKVTERHSTRATFSLPGMLYARVLRAPGARGRTASMVDTSGVGGIDGVVLVQQPDLVAVLHELPDVAEDALWQAPRRV